MMILMMMQLIKPMELQRLLMILMKILVEEVEDYLGTFPHMEKIKKIIRLTPNMVLLYYIFFIKISHNKKNT